MGQLPGPVDNESWSSSSSSSVRCEVYVGNNETERCTDWQYYGDVGHTIVSQVRLPPASAPETCVGFSFQWEREHEYANDENDGKSRLRVTTGIGPATFSWLGSRVVCVLDSGAEGPGFKSQPRRSRVTVLGKLFTPIVPLFTKQQIGSSPPKGCGGNCRPGGKYWQPTAGFMTHVTCRLTAKNRGSAPEPYAR